MALKVRRNDDATPPANVAPRSLGHVALAHVRCGSGALIQIVLAGESRDIRPRTRRDVRRAPSCSRGAGPCAPWMARQSLQGSIYGVSGTATTRQRRTQVIVAFVARVECARTQSLAVATAPA